NRDADAVVAALLPFAHLRVLARIETARVRIERAEYAADRAVYEAFGLRLVGVARLHRVQRRGECPIMLRDFVVGRERAASEETANEGGHEECEDHGRQRTVTSHNPHGSR